ncbi:MAG: hypothetical protein AAF203_07000, partial [Pseudomonadota bacterium]
MERISSILQHDIKMATTPVSQLDIEGKSFEEKICFYTSHGSKGDQALYLIQKNGNEDLLSLRTYVNTGHFKKAKALLENETQSKDSEVQAEYLLQKARLHGFEEDWRGCVEFCEQGLALRPMEITQLSFLQCRAMAFYELGFIGNALYECNLILSQEKLYPESMAVRYAWPLKIKCHLAQGNLEVSRPILHRLWSDFFKKGYELDSLLTLLRLEIDFCRAEKRPIDGLAKASFAVAKLLGDRLYEAMSLFDLQSAHSVENQSLKAQLDLYAGEFKKIKSWRNQICDRKPQFTSVERILRTFQQPNEFSFDPLLEWDKIVLTRYNAVIDLKTERVHLFKDFKNKEKLGA